MSIVAPSGARTPDGAILHVTESRLRPATWPVEVFMDEIGKASPQIKCLDDILRVVVERGASDLHLQAEHLPCCVYTNI